MTENKRYQLRQEQLDYPIVNFCCDLIDTEDNNKVICSFENNVGTSKIVDLLNGKEEQIKNLEKQNEELIQVIKGISKDSADAISRIWNKSVYDD